MANSNSLKETREIIENFFETKTEIGTKKNIQCWLGLDPKITMEDIYMKKSIERMNILGMNFSLIKQKAELFLDTSEIPDFNFNKIKVRDKLKTKELRKECMEFFENIKERKREHDEIFINILNLKETEEEQKLASLINEFFYRIKVVKRNFLATKARIVDGTIYFDFNKNNYLQNKKEEEFYYKTNAIVLSTLIERKKRIVHFAKQDGAIIKFNETFKNLFDKKITELYYYKEILKIMGPDLFESCSTTNKEALKRLFENEWVLNKYIKEKDKRKENFNLIMKFVIFADDFTIPLINKNGDLIVKRQALDKELDWSKTARRLEQFFVTNIGFNIGKQKKVMLEDFKNKSFIENLILMETNLTAKQIKKIKNLKWEE